MVKKGNLSINSENIFPIIKKWLYSDHDIFIRELVSNASDAITKLKSLASLGEADLKDDKDFKIIVKYDDEKSTIQIIDNGIGMDSEEIEKYINQIAFSGATEFVNKFKDKEGNDQIIGHFGLGFYSAFMVSSLVTIETLSYKEGAEAVLWSCDGSHEFEIKKSDKSDRGTIITLYLNDDGKEFKNGYKIKNTIKKYCNFMPYEIYFIDIKEENEKLKKELEKSKTDDIDDSSISETPEDGFKIIDGYKLSHINDIKPLYTKSPSECSDEDYRDFYRDLFLDFKEPLFWIHLNMDYPFNLKGILYFPKLNTEFDAIEGQIKLYNNQVYIADNIKEVIPEFLLLLKGVIDCPDLPLNVSRSFLQNDGFVKKISEYIVKKVADKLNSLYKLDRENYEKYWLDINPFIKFGSLRDEKFYDKIKDSIIYQLTDDKFVTLEEYRNSVKDELKNTIYYTNDKVQQARYIRLLNDNDIKVFDMKERIDSAFISLIESKNTDVKFKRVDSDLSEVLDDKKEFTEEEVGFNKKIGELFAKVLNLKELNTEVRNLNTKDVVAMIVEPEENRRMNDMMKMYQMPNMPSLPSNEIFILNSNSDIGKYIIDNSEKNSDSLDLIINHTYDLAKLTYKGLNPDEMEEFIKRSNKLMSNQLD